MTTEDKYKFLRLAIKEFGTAFAKKHGNWIITPYTDDHFFLLDTWNGAIQLYRFKENCVPVYEYWCGFEKNENLVYVKSIASNWGGFSDYLKDDEMYDHYAETLQWLYTDTKRRKLNGA